MCVREQKGAHARTDETERAKDLFEATHKSVLAPQVGKFYPQEIEKDFEKEDSGQDTGTALLRQHRGFHSGKQVGLVLGNRPGSCLHRRNKAGLQQSGA